MNIGSYQPTLELPVLAPAVVREENGTAASGHDGPGVDAARASCEKLRGPAREMCYKALARNNS